MKSDLKPTNPKDRAATSRLDLSLFPQTAIIYGALGMTEGDCKYGGYNYRVGGVLFSVYVAACLRHIFKCYNGEWRDPKTKVPHMASAIADLGIIVDAFECGVLRDDRPPRANIAKLLDTCEELVAHLHQLFPDGPGRYTQKGVEDGIYAAATKLPILKENARRKIKRKEVPSVRTDWIRTKKAPRRARQSSARKV
jgi:hypothetical protein